MACSKIANKLENILECGVCKDIVQKPMRLTCFHAFCKSCIKTQKEQKENDESGIFCPVCKVFCKKNCIKSSVFINELLDAYIMSQDGEHKCQQCNKNESKWHCLECKMDFCEDCKLNHLKIPLLRNHRFVDRMKTNDIFIDSLVFCETHTDEPIKFNCQTCNSLICIMCKVTKHENHKTEAIQENLDRIVLEVKKNANKLEEKVTNLGKHHEAILMKMDEVKDCYTKCRDEARNNLNEVIEKAKERHKQVVKELDDQEEEELAKLKAGKSDIENKQKEYSHLSKWINATVEMAKGVTFVAEMQGDLYDRVAERAKSRVHTPILVQTPQLEANICEKGMKSMIGNVKYKSVRVSSNVVRIGSGRIPPMPFNELFQKQFKHCLDINLPSRATRMDTINGDIWIPLPGNQFIQVYDIHGNELRKVLLNGHVGYVVKQMANGDIILASNTGLHKINEDGQILSTIASIAFSDFDSFEDKIAAISLNSNLVYIFQFVNDNWIQEKTISSNSGYAYFQEDTISWANESIYVSNKNYCQYIYQYNSNLGTFIKIHNVGYSSPFICGSDKEGNICINYIGHNMLYLLSKDGGWTNIANPGFSYVHDIISSDEDTIWVLHNNGNMLTQYEYQ